AGAREHLAAQLRPLTAPPPTIRWASIATGTIAAALVLASVFPRLAPPPVVRQEPADFVAIPYLPPLDPRENTAVVRMNIRVATLTSLGYRIASDPNALLPAEVLVGEDGR